MPPDPLTWYVALVWAGKERAAQDHLIEAGFSETFCPRRRSVRMVRGQPLEIIGPLTHGYIYVRTFAFTPDLWHLVVRPTEQKHPRYGLVYGFIGGWPANPVPVDAIEIAKSMCDEEGIALPILAAGPKLYEPGTHVRVAGYEYDNQTFVVLCDNGPKGIQLKPLQSTVDAVYIRERVRISPLLDAGPSPDKEEGGSRRGKRRLFRRARSVPVKSVIESFT